MSDEEVDKGKRCFLVAATSVVGGVVAGTAAVPFIGSMLPSERAKAAGAPVEADISQLAEGEMMRIEWRGSLFDLAGRVYRNKPARLVRHRIGIYVLFLLGVLFVLAYALKQEYWKDVH